MDKYYINYNYDNARLATKAKKDSELIFEAAGFKKALPDNLVTHKQSALRILYVTTTAIKRLPKGSVIALNYPPYGFIRFWVYQLLDWFKKRKQFKIILLVHDIADLHDRGIYTSKNYRFFNKYLELKILTRYDVLIVHNQKMKDWLIEKGFNENKIIPLGLFDYLSDTQNTGGTYGTSGSDIVIAGSFDSRKVPYLNTIYKLGTLHFHLYGPDLAETVQAYANVQYFGNFPSEQVLSELKGSYGLVWDSQSFQGGDGEFGAYQRYNDPHKASLYLAAGFPLIVWRGSALADFVRENELGLTVNNLNQLPHTLSTIDLAAYQIMKSNALEVGKQLREGAYLKRALEKAQAVL